MLVKCARLMILSVLASTILAFSMHRGLFSNVHVAHMSAVDPIDGRLNSKFGEKKFYTAREEAPSLSSNLAAFANCCTEKRHKKTVTYNEDDCFLGLPTDRITELVVDSVPLWARCEHKFARLL